MTRTTRIGTWAALVALAAIGCKKPETSAKTVVDADAPVAVSLVEAQEMKAPRLVTLSGTLAGSEEAEVAAGAAGKVIATYVERGSVVKKGAVLARLDSRAASAQAAQAAADAEGSKIQAQQAKLDCDRTEHMFQKGAISKADYDRAHTQCEGSKWTVSSAEARKTLTAEALRDTEIRAPFSGMVVDRAVSRGRIRAARLARRDAGRHRFAARRDHGARGRHRVREAGDAGRLPDLGTAATRCITARSATSGRRCAARAATRSSRRCSPTRRRSCARGCS